MGEKALRGRVVSFSYKGLRWDDGKVESVGVGQCIGGQDRKGRDGNKVEMKVQFLASLLLSVCVFSAGVEAHVHNHNAGSQRVLKVEDKVVVGKDNNGEPIVIEELTEGIGEVAAEVEEASETMVTYVFNKLFPFGPAGNALLATTYISGPPNLILALIPSDINVSSLSLLVSFAIGGLLGDVFMHLLPETFTGQSVDLVVGDQVYVLVDNRKNVLLGIGMFVGFLLFFGIDKLMRIIEHTGNASAGGASGHSHSHSHSHASATSSGLPEEKSGELKQRGAKKDGSAATATGAATETEAVIANPNASIKTSAYLNLISDFTHNITDGLAISSSFYISKSVGCTTAIATFMHEIPHEVGDFALLIQGGFTKWQAMGSQFVTAAGAYLGTFIGIALQQSLEKDRAAASAMASSLDSSAPTGLFGTSLSYGDMTLPFTAGGFLYIAFSVIPELLETEEDTDRSAELAKFAKQLVCMFLGIGFMAFIALND